MIEIISINENKTVDFIADKMLHESIDYFESQEEREDLEYRGFVRGWYGDTEIWVDSRDIWG